MTTFKCSHVPCQNPADANCDPGHCKFCHDWVSKQGKPDDSCPCTQPAEHEPFQDKHGRWLRPTGKFRPARDGELSLMPHNWANRTHCVPSISASIDHVIILEPYTPPAKRYRVTVELNEAEFHTCRNTTWIPDWAIGARVQGAIRAGNYEEVTGDS